MEETLDKVAQDRQLLKEAQEGGILGRGKTYFKLSGPGWIASAITLGGGSLASSLYLGVLGGYSLLWVQPFAMILGVIMLAAIGYVTLSSGERPFRAINDHVNPVLGWGWALAVAAANIVWCMPQYSLATGVLSQNLLPSMLGADGSMVSWAANSLGFAAAEGNSAIAAAQSVLAGGVSTEQHSYAAAWLAINANRVFVSVTILVFATIVTSSYDRGGWGLRLYETVLKIMVAMIVFCFLGVIVKLTFSDSPLDWSAVLAGFVPDFGQIWRPAASFQPLLSAVADEGARTYWTDLIVAEQRDVMISAAATAVGINMTLMFPYTMLRKGWTREFRGLAIFDLCTGMFIPYVLATGFVVIAAGAAFHTHVPEGFALQVAEDGRVVSFSEPDLSPEALAERTPADQSRVRANANKFTGVMAARNAAVPDAPPDLAEQGIGSMLVKRDTFDLAAALAPLTTEFFANLIFGLGVLAMVLSTISILMLISGFVFAEMTGCPPGGKMHKFGLLVAGVGGAMWPFFWVGGASQAFLAIVASVYGFMLLPFAYVTFVFLLNSRSLLGGDMPRGFRRFLWNTLAIFAATVSTVAACYMIWTKAGWMGVMAVVLYIGLAVMVDLNRRNRRQEETMRIQAPRPAAVSE